MAVTGVFAADFSAFDKAVKTSEANLAGLESAGGKVEKSLRLVTQSQEQLLDQIGASGGKIQELGTTAESTGGQVNTLSQSYKQFDGLLQAAGVNIGPQVKGLEDLANAAGKSTTELGLLGTAGAVAGAALAGWKLGTWIGEITGATEAIANLTGSLDRLSEQTAGAKQDTINLAIRQGAKETISYADAIKYLTDQVQVNADKSINWREKLADAHREVRNLTAAQKDEIAIALEAGATTEQLTNKYGISAQGLEILTGRQKDAAAATAQHARESEALARAKEAEAAALEKAYAALMSNVKNENQLAIMNADRAKMDEAATAAKWKSTEAFKAGVAAVAEANTATAAYLTEQEKMTAANDATWQSLEQTTDAHLEAGAAASAGTAATVQGYQAVAQQVEITSDGVKGWLELMRATNAANALLSQNSLFTTGSTLENQSRLGTAFSPIPGFASGVENFEGGLAKVHGGEVLANLPRGTSVFPKGSGFGGANVSNVFNLVDTESNLAKRVAEMIMRQIRAGTQLGTA
jgi:hypothetical protein